MWQGTLGSLQELRMVLRGQPARKWGLQSYSHKQLNFANRHLSLEEDLDLQKGIEPANTLIMTL